MTIIFVASSLPGSDLPTLGTWDLFAKKGGHMFGYALLATAYFRALNNGRSVTWLQFISAFVLACLYAASDEWHQRFIPGRSSSILDICIDAVGAGIGLLLWRVLRTRLRRRKNLEFSGRNSELSDQASR
jgi:VanZ family protein